MSVTLRTTPSRLSIALTNCESLSVRIGSAARPGGVNIPRCSFTNETSGVGAEARRSPTIDGLDAIIELFSKLGFDVGFNLLGDFPESRNMGPLIRSPIARGGRRARCRQPVLSSATSRTSSTCSASNAPGAVAKAGINAGRRKPACAASRAVLARKWRRTNYFQRLRSGSRNIAGRTLGEAAAAATELCFSIRCEVLDYEHDQRAGDHG